LLEAAGYEFDVAAPDVDETRNDGESPRAYVARLARAKAGVVALQHPARVVLGADTTVVVDDEVLGKPVDAADAARMLRRLSGRVHQVLTAVSLMSPEGVCHEAIETTTVEMRMLSDEDIAWYVRSTEPMDKAGAYAIQGLASRFVPRIEGSYTNVVGLPITAIAELFRRAGLSWR
jgi:septum formation protein